MSRNSKVVAFSGESDGDTSDQVDPLVVVRSTVPAVPETQTILSETGERPRNWRVLFVGVRVQDNVEGLIGWWFGRATAGEVDTSISASRAYACHVCFIAAYLSRRDAHERSIETSIVSMHKIEDPASRFL